jgi:hypothetical protein
VTTPPERKPASQAKAAEIRAEIARIDARRKRDAALRENLVEALKAGRMLPEPGSEWVAVEGASGWASMVKGGTVLGCGPLYDDRGNRHIVVFSEGGGDVTAVPLDDFVVGYVPGKRKKRRKGAGRG